MPPGYNRLHPVTARLQSVATGYIRLPPGVRTSPETIAVGSLLFQAAVLFATVGGLVLESSPLFIAATMITVVTMSVATAGFMGEIGDKKSTVSNNRR